MIFLHVLWQSYVINLTLDRAGGVAGQASINFVDPITDSDAPGLELTPPPQNLQKRVPEHENLQERPHSDQHLRVISVANQQTRSSPLPNYLSNPLLGQDQTIYILDAGFNLANDEASTESGRTV